MHVHHVQDSPNFCVCSLRSGRSPAHLKAAEAAELRSGEADRGEPSALTAVKALAFEGAQPRAYASGAASFLSDYDAHYHPHHHHPPTPHHHPHHQQSHRHAT